MGLHAKILSEFVKRPKLIFKQNNEKLATMDIDAAFFLLLYRFNIKELYFIFYLVFKLSPVFIQVNIYSCHPTVNCGLGNCN